MILHDIRVAAIRHLSVTHLSPCEAEDWAGRGGPARVERAIANDEVWVALLDSAVVGWIHRSDNSIEGLYVSPHAACQGVGTALVRLAEGRIALTGKQLVVLESSLNAVGFYVRLGYSPSGSPSPSGAVPMHKQHAAAA
jgi:ribosomal protein S18 acetylase RimI-like enzyme